MAPDPLADLAQLEGVAEAVATARAALDAVLRDRGLRTVTAAQSAQALVAGARANAALTEDPERWLPGCVRLSTELAALSALVRVAPGQALARAHVLAASGAVPKARLGRVRAEPEVSRRMLQLNELLTGASQAPALVLAAVVHAEIAIIEPFGSADRVVARAVEHMVLISAGVDPRAVIVSEAGHAAHPDSYRVALRGYADGTLDGVRGWILHCAQALVIGATMSPVAGEVDQERRQRGGRT
jgi:hypothetical protein